MFDERSKYDIHDYDLTQIVSEFMLKTVYKAYNLNLLTWTIEIESNDDEYEIEKVDEEFSISLFHSLDKTSTFEILKNQLALLFSSSSRSISKSIIDLFIDNKQKKKNKTKSWSNEYFVWKSV